MNRNSKLQIEAVRNKFKGYNFITIQDFYDFYNEILGDIRLNTVRGYIYELKELGVIHHLSRGKYILESNDIETNNDCVVLTMDVIDSSKYNFDEFNKDVRTKITSLNSVLNEKYNYNNYFNVSRGDEIQIVLPLDEYLGEIIVLSLSHLYPYKLRYVLSIGEILGAHRENSWDMNEPIFWNARNQMDKISSEKEYSSLIVSGYSNVDKILNNFFPLINKEIERITEKQWEVIKLNLSGKTIDEIINEVGISKSSYYDRMNHSNIDRILLSFKSIFDLIKIRKVIN